MARGVYVNEPNASRRRVYFQLVDVTDGMTPELGEVGGQPEVSLDGGAWSNANIGVLAAIGNGRYYADLVPNAVAAVGTVIESRYKSLNTAECPGDTLFVLPLSAGSGSVVFTYTVTDSVTALPMSDVSVWVSTDIGGSNVVTAVLQTDALGRVIFYLDPGTYYFWRQKAGWSGVNPDVEVVG